MSDFERGKYYGKKKFNSRNDRSDAKGAYNSRFFNKSIYNPDKDSHEPDTDKKEKKQPQILIKTREKTEERSVSPKRTHKESESNSTGKEVNSSTPSDGHAAQNVKLMSKSMKLLEDGMLFNEALAEYLNTSSDFLVVGVIGEQGVGKSTLMNLLASDGISDNLKNKLFKVPKDDDEDDGIKILLENFSKWSTSESTEQANVIFQTASQDDIECCSNTTNGIDIFITENRLILLDCQPFLSLSVCDDLMRNESKRLNIIGDFPPLANLEELQGLQYIAFLMSVCHILIFVEDFFMNSNNIRFLLTAEMLKPTISNNEEEYIEQFPHLLIVHNKAQMEDFAPPRFKFIQDIYRQMFAGSKMHLESSMGLATGKIMPSLNPDVCGNPINLYLIPEYDETKERLFKGHPQFEELIKRLKMNVLCSTKYQITHVPLHEKNWLAYCGKVWEHVRKSSFYVEYTRLLP